MHVSYDKRPKVLLSSSSDVKQLKASVSDALLAAGLKIEQEAFMNETASASYDETLNIALTYIDDMAYDDLDDDCLESKNVW